MKAADVLFAQNQNTERDNIESVIAGLFVVDYGVIKAMRGTASCDVIHAVKRARSTGEYFDETVTEDVEVLWPASAGCSIQFDLAAGDRVLLIGMKHCLTTVDVNSASEQETFGAYTQESLKAIPLCVFNSSAGVKIQEHSGDLSLDTGAGKLELKNTLTSLKTLMDSLCDTLTTMSATPAVNGSPIYAGGAASWPALKTQIGSLLK
jgi:hypothetical protein